MYSLASTTWDNEEVEVASKLLSSGKLTMGPEVAEIEKEKAPQTSVGLFHAVTQVSFSDTVTRAG